MNIENQNMSLLSLIEAKYKRTNNLVAFQVGDIIKVNYRITEGEKERLQSYEGIVIGFQNRGLGKSFTIRRIIDGIGIEQIFLVHSPKIESIQKKGTTKVRRSKLYYLRAKIGKIF